MSFTNGAQQHPAVAESIKRLAELERRTPPGYPLGYNLHLHTWLCQGCGATGKSSLLWTVLRAGSNGKSYHVTHASEKVYDLPVDTVQKHEVTMRCEGCIATLPREPVPALPAYKAKLYKGKDAKDLEIDLDDLFKDTTIDLEALGLL